LFVSGIEPAALRRFGGGSIERSAEIQTQLSPSPVRYLRIERSSKH
jgi:hypothetical protein